jgi:rare lipoprotein A
VSPKGVAASLRAIALAAVALLSGARVEAQASGVGPGWTQSGVASWYGPGFHGRLTANGERFDKEAMTAAHRTLPFDTWLRVTNLDNGLECEVRVNDRGPFAKDRILDLSEAAARKVDMIRSGTARVRITVIPPPDQSAAKPVTWRIQVASYSVAANAERTAGLLRSKGLSPVIERASGLHRVVLTGVPDADKERVIALLASLGFRSPLVTRE